MIFNVGSSSWYGRRVFGWLGGGRWGLEGNGRGAVKVPSKECAEGAVHKAMHSGAEQPTKDSVEGNWIALPSGKV